MKDKFISGSLAGFISAILQAIIGHLFKVFGFSDRAFHDYGQAFILYLPQNGLLSDFVGLIAHVSNGMVFGVIFAYLILLTSSRFNLLKGAIYGMALWQIFLGLGTLFKMPMFHPIPPSSAFSTLIGSVIYGVAVAYTLRKIESRTTLV